MLDTKLSSKYLYITLVICFYWIISISTVFINKILLSGDTINLGAPLFITWFQCITSVLICIILNHVSKHFPQFIKITIDNPFDKNRMKKILPLSILFTGMIASNNLCLKYVSVAFYYIGRSLTTVFNVVFTYFVLGQKTSVSCIGCCFIIILGFWLGVDQESDAGSLSLLGTIFGILGSLTLAMYSVHMKKVLATVNQNIWLLSYYNNVYGIILLLPLMLINGEHIIVYNYNQIGDILFWLKMLMGGICGFAIGYATTLQIKVTSPLTHNISGTAKACAQTVLATYVYSDTKSVLWWLGNIIVLAASAAYARIKQLEMYSMRYTQNPLIKA